MDYLCFMNEELQRIQEQAIELKKENKKFLDRLNQKPPKHLDVKMKELHEETFKEIDCLSCGNCCKTTVPIITNKDSERIAKHLKMKIHDFETKYVHIESDTLKSFKMAPCEFLMDDNHCMIYDVRPKACSEYPHTTRNKFHQLSRITLENTVVCPATSVIIERLKDHLDKTQKKSNRRK